MKDPVLQQLSHFSSEYSAHPHIYLAYSGGLDSTVLLHALCETLPDRKLLTALHINHNLQLESAEWVKRCESQCRVLGVNLRVHNVNLDSGSHEEERARNARYEFFSKTLETDDLLLMAHHRNDAVETFIFRLMRGGSSSGLVGIPERRNLGRGVLHRPLLKLGRAQLEAYASANALEWIQDPSNLNIRFDRNYIRARVLPVLLQRWPGAVEHVSESIARLAEDNHIIAAWLDEHLVPMQVSRWELDLTILARYPETQRLRLLRHWLESCGCFHIGKTQLEEIDRQCSGSGGVNACFTVPGLPEAEPGFEYQLRRYGKHFQFCMVYVGAMDSCYAWEVASDSSPQILELPHGRLAIRLDPRSSSAISLEIRFSVPGQKVHLFSASKPSGYHKSLTDLLQEAGVPPWQRAQYPLVYHGQNLLGIPGVRTLVAGGEGDEPREITWTPKQPPDSLENN